MLIYISYFHINNRYILTIDIHIVHECTVRDDPNVGAMSGTSIPLGSAMSRENLAVQPFSCYRI